MESTTRFEASGISRWKRPNAARLIEELHYSQKSAKELNEHCFKSPIFVKALWLDRNQLRELPSNVLSVYLRELYIDDNSITSLRTDLTRCKFLEVLSAAKNLITNLSLQVQILSKLKYLKVLTLAGNPITDAPAYRAKVVAGLSSLELLDHVKVTVNERTRAVAADKSKLYELGKQTQRVAKDSQQYTLGRQSMPLVARCKPNDNAHSSAAGTPSWQPPVSSSRATFPGFSRLEKEIWQRAEALSLARSRTRPEKTTFLSDPSREAQAISILASKTASVSTDDVSILRKRKFPIFRFAVDISPLCQPASSFRCVISEWSTGSSSSLLHAANKENRRTFSPVNGDAEKGRTLEGPLTEREKDVMKTMCSDWLVAHSNRDKQGGMQFPVSSDCLRSFTEFLNSDKAGIGKIPLSLHGALAAPDAVSKTTPRNNPVRTTSPISNGAAKGSANPISTVSAPTGSRQPVKGDAQLAKPLPASENATTGIRQALTAADVLECLLASNWIKRDQTEIQRDMEGAYLDAQILFEEGKEAEAFTSALLASEEKWHCTILALGVY